MNFREFVANICDDMHDLRFWTRIRFRAARGRLRNRLDYFVFLLRHRKHGLQPVKVSTGDGIIYDMTLCVKCLIGMSVERVCTSRDVGAVVHFATATGEHR